MTYELFIGDRTFSSWSLRGWLMFEKFGLPCKTTLVGLYSGTMGNDLASLSPARLVPVLRTPQGDIIGETLSIAETIAERHPGIDMWPKAPSERARARWLCAEMVSGFSALRSQCPMQLQHVNKGFHASEAVKSDLARLQLIWAAAREIATHSGPWLFGAYSLADVFFAPVAARIIGYDLRVDDAAQSYCNTVISDPAFTKWRHAGLQITYDPFPYPADCACSDWPVPLRINPS